MDINLSSSSSTTTTSSSSSLRATPAACDGHNTLAPPQQQQLLIGDADGIGASFPHENNPATVTSGRRTSRVWKYFRMVDNCHYVCCLCNFVGAYTNTTNMRKHIQNHHPEIFQDILDHTRPSNRLHYLRNFQAPYFQNTTPAAATHYGQSLLNASQPLQGGAACGGGGNFAYLPHQQPQFPETDQSTEGLAEEGEAACLGTSHSNAFPHREQLWGKHAESLKSCPTPKLSTRLSCKAESKPQEGYGLSLESYKLRHNNHLNLVLESLAGDESFMDVTLTAQGKAIKAHKSVLSAVSPYFRSVLRENPCQHPIIIMPRDIRFEELSNIISYVYKGEMTVAADDLSSLLKTAELLQVTGLSPSETGGSSGGIMSQMQGIPTPAQVALSPFPGHVAVTASRKGNKLKSYLHPTSDVITPDPPERIDPLEFLNTDMTCVKEEIPSENEDAEEPGFSLPEGAGSSATTETSVSENSCTSPGRRKSLTGSPRPVDDCGMKPFNPGDPDRTSPVDDSSSSSSETLTPFLCPHCLESYRPLDALQSHLRLKHPSKPSFPCKCGRVYARLSLLTEHTKWCKV